MEEQRQVQRDLCAEMNDLIAEIEARFKSGNDVPVTRARLDLDEWNRIKAALEAAKEMHSLLSEPGGMTPEIVRDTQAFNAFCEKVDSDIKAACAKFRAAMGGEG